MHRRKLLGVLALLLPSTALSAAAWVPDTKQPPSKAEALARLGKVQQFLRDVFVVKQPRLVGEPIYDKYVHINFFLRREDFELLKTDLDAAIAMLKETL